MTDLTMHDWVSFIGGLVFFSIILYGMYQIKKQDEEYKPYDINK